MITETPGLFQRLREKRSEFERGQEEASKQRVSVHWSPPLGRCAVKDCPKPAIDRINPYGFGGGGWNTTPVTEGRCEDHGGGNQMVWFADPCKDAEHNAMGPILDALERDKRRFEAVATFLDDHQCPQEGCVMCLAEAEACAAIDGLDRLDASRADMTGEV